MQRFAYGHRIWEQTLGNGETQEGVLENQSKTPQADSYIKRDAEEGSPVRGDSIPDVALEPPQPLPSAPPQKPTACLPCFCSGPAYSPEAGLSAWRELLPLAPSTARVCPPTWNSCRVGTGPAAGLEFPHLASCMAPRARSTNRGACVAPPGETDWRALGA